MQKKLRFLVCAALALIMVLIAETAGEREIIFPEIVALLLGGLACQKQPWKVTGPMLLLLMTLSAACGWGLALLPGVALYAKLLIGFLFAASALILTRTTLAPILSACILPILLHTTTWIYPVSVFCATAAIVLARSFFVRRGWVEPPVANIGPADWREELALWGKLFALFALFSVGPAYSGHLYWIAPPLLVMFVECAGFHPALQKDAKKLLPFLCFSALLGAASRYLLVDLAHLPLTLSALVTIALLLAAANKFDLFFPPAGALAFLPLLLPAEGLPLYPIEASLGACLFFGAAILCFSPRKKAVTAPVSEKET